MDTPALVCQDDRRRDLVRSSQFFGLDYLEVSADQLTLTVYFLGRAPAEITVTHLQIYGGERITGIRVTKVDVQRSDDAALDDVMNVTVDQPGDFSSYRLCVRALDKRGRPTDRSMAGFDPRYACLDFNFKAGCPSDLDCKSPMICPPPSRTEPEINYLAKDYSSFRQLIFDRLAVIMPDWKERHVPDIGVALVEILAYAGDQLSYYQDAVATEAYLATARQRISVRRHARLVDYLMHEGCNARAWVCVKSSMDVALPASDTSFLAGLDQITALSNKVILQPEDLKNISPGAYEVFEPLVTENTTSIPLHVAHNEIAIYTWGDRQCCLPTGATRAVLRDLWDKPSSTVTTNGDRERKNQTESARPARQLKLRAGDVIVFEEIKGPITGNPADADPTRRWAVRLTRVTPLTDELKMSDGRPTPLVEIEWAAADALPFPFCLSARLPAPACCVITDISVVRGNVVLVDHGKKIQPPEDIGTVEKTGQTGDCACEGSVIEMSFVPGLFRPYLEYSPLTYRSCFSSGGPASGMLKQDPRAALPAISLSSIPPVPDGGSAIFTRDDLQDPGSLAGVLHSRQTSNAQFLYSRLSVDTKKALEKWDGKNAPADSLLKAIAADLTAELETWLPQLDLLESGPSDGQFVVEVDDDGRAHLRFGDGINGRQPDAGMNFLASYRVGNGTSGNVSAEKINKILFRNTTFDGLTLSLRNPLPAQGGVDSEPVAEVKLFAPDAFRRKLKRAVTAEDYSTLTEQNPRVQQANTALRWTGSWYEAAVAVDPLASETSDDATLRHLAGHLHRYRRLGHDLTVNSARYVPLEIALDICVLPHYLRGHVESALLDVFSNRVLPAGQRGFFHPDNLSFGDGIYLSRLIRTAQAVAGVQSVTVTAFHRLFGSAGDELATGVLALQPMEIARLDNDPNFPEHGKLTLNLRGGR